MNLYELTPEHVHLWLCFYGEIQDESTLARYQELLSPEECIQQKRFHFVRHQRRYLITRALARTVLSCYTAIPPKELLFSQNEYGKPGIVHDHRQKNGVSFNISHTQGLILIGVTHEKALGVDVENISVRSAPTEIAAHFFSSAEHTALETLSKEKQHEQFFKIWTLKESYIKARGMGLSIPLDQFAFKVGQEGDVDFSVYDEATDQASRWHFWQLQPSPDYLAAVCVERSQGIKPILSVRKVVPGEAGQLWDGLVLAESI